MTSPRYLIVDTYGDVHGTNDHDALPDVYSDECLTIIDTLQNTYSHEDVDDVDIEDFEPESDSDDGDEASLDGVGAGGAKDPV